MKPARLLLALALATLSASTAAGQQPPPSLKPADGASPPSAAALPAPVASDAAAPAPVTQFILPEAPTTPAVMPSESFDLGGSTPGGASSPNASGRLSQYGGTQNAVAGGMAPYGYPQYADPATPEPTRIYNSYGMGWLDDCSPPVPPSHRFYVTPEVWAMHRADATWRDIAVVSATNSSLLRTSDPDFGYEMIPKLTAGYAWTDWALEGTVYYIDDIDGQVDGQLANNMSAVFFGLQGANSDWTNASIMHLNMATGFHSYETNVVRFGGYAQWLFGVRYIEVRDRLAVTTSKTAISDGSIGTYNGLLGGQLGARIAHDFAGFTLEGTLKAGIYHNNGKSSTFIRDFGNTTILRNARAIGQNDAYQAEGVLSVGYRPWTPVLVRGGYQVMWIGDIALAADQIDQRTTSGVNMTGGSLNDHGDLWMVGPFAGVEIQW